MASESKWVTNVWTLGLQNLGATRAARVLTPFPTYLLNLEPAVSSFRWFARINLATKVWIIEPIFIINAEPKFPYGIPVEPP